MKSPIGDAIRFRHILDAIAEIESYVNESVFEEFIQNSMMLFACIKQLEIIGEAANHISDETKEKYSGIDWRDIIGLRHILIHDYFGIDEKIVWEIIRNDIPKLRKYIGEIIYVANKDLNDGENLLDS